MTVFKIVHDPNIYHHMHEDCHNTTNCLIKTSKLVVPLLIYA